MTYKEPILRLSSPVVPEHELGSSRVRFREAKAAKRKEGYRAVTWRVGDADESRGMVLDRIDVLIVFVRDVGNFGAFIFSRETLIRHGLLPVGGENKAAFKFRVFPPWVCPAGKADTITQAWQLPLFLPISRGGIYDESAANDLLADPTNDFIPDKKFSRR
ncbi:MepB family protein [Agreia bicolorata]|nr:MepB family protein [Agreia bicolorata]